MNLKLILLSIFLLLIIKSICIPSKNDEKGENEDIAGCEEKGTISQ